MKATELIGQKAIRFKPNCKGDYSYNSDPVIILEATETHIMIEFCDKILKGETHILDTRFCDDYWIAYDNIWENGISQENTMINNDDFNNATNNTTDENIQIEYCVNLTQLAKLNKLDIIKYRDEEIQQLIEVLLLKKKPNPLLIGDAGVGKTAIVEGLAQKIVSGEVPNKLKNCSILTLDMGSLLAGTKYRGMFEERLQDIIKEVTKNRSIILFIDEIHTVIGAGGAEGAIDASNILKPELARGDMRIIGATTRSEYQKFISHDKAFNRRFQTIDVQEMGVDKSIKLLTDIKYTYENYHNVKISDDIIINVVKLANKYINSSKLPDTAITLLDQICVSTYLHNAKNVTMNYVNQIIDSKYRTEKDFAIGFTN